MHVLRLLGGASFDGEINRGPATQRHRIALLAILIVGRPHPIRRERLTGLLWPERDTEPARKLLNQSVYVLRQALGENTLASSSDALRIDAARLRCDLVDFEQALAAGELERAVSLYGGAFLDGFFLDDAEEFQRWLEGERARLAQCHANALEKLATDAEEHNDWRRAMHWWKALTTLEPYDTRVVSRLIQAMDTAGDRAGALQLAGAHQRLLRDELGASPPTGFTQLLARLRSPSHTTAAVTAEPGQDAVAGASTRTAPERAGPEQASAHTSRETRQRLLAGAALLVVMALVAGWYQFTNRIEPHGNPVNAATDVKRTARPASERTTSVAAYELYRRGSDPAALRSDETAREARDALRQAVSLDPNYAAAWVALARMSLRVGAASTWKMTADANASAREAAARALELDDALAEAHATMGLLSLVDFDFQNAEPFLDHAIDLEPSNATTRDWRAALYLWTARTADALADAESASATNPLAPIPHAEVARVLGADGRCREALARLERIGALTPPVGRVAIIAAHCNARLGQWQHALTELGANLPLHQALRGHLLARYGSRTDAKAIREQLVTRYQAGEVGAFPLAVIDAGLGDNDSAIEWLTLSLDDQSLAGTPDHLTVMLAVLEAMPDEPRLNHFKPLAPLLARRLNAARGAITVSQHPAGR